MSTTTAMSPVIRRVLLGNSLSALGNGLTIPLLIVYLGQVRDLGTATAGLVLTVMALVTLVLMPATGILVDRLGPRPVLIGGLLVQSLGVALLTQVTSAGSAFAIAAIVAAGSAFTWSPQAALLGRLTMPSQRQRVFGIQFMLLNLGIGLGGLVSATIANVEAPDTFVVLYLLDAASFLAYVVVLLTLKGVGMGPAPGPVQGAGDTPHPPGGYREVFGDRTLLRIVMLGLVLLTCGYGSLMVGMPIFVTVVNGLSVSWVGIAFAVNTATIVVAQLTVIRLIDNRSRSRVLAMIAGLWAASWVIMGVTGLLPPALSIAGILLSSAVFAVGETFWSPVAPALINDLAPDHLRGRYNSVQSLVWGVSGALGPALAGLLLGSGLVAVWVALIVLGCTVAAVMALRLRSHLTPALDGRATR